MSPSGGSSCEEFMTEANYETKEALITLTSDIVSAQLSNNSVPVDAVPGLITSVYADLAKLG